MKEKLGKVLMETFTEPTPAEFPSNSLHITGGPNGPPPPTMSSAPIQAGPTAIQSLTGPSSTGD